MGNSCSSGQAHKDRDNTSERSEESGSYQVRGALPPEKQQILLNNIKNSNSEVILEPTTAGQTTLQKPVDHHAEKKTTFTKFLKGVAESSISASDSLSLNSPPSVQSPKGFEGQLPKEIQSLQENLQNLIMGRVLLTQTIIRMKKIVIYVCAADSQDCCVEKGALHNIVYPELRSHCRSKGYELHIVDLHWKTILEKQQDHEFPELCIGELTRQMEVAYIIPVLFLNNSLGTPLLPITIESTDFKMAMDSAENQSSQTLLSKWYQLDSDAQPPCYRLQPISSHIHGFKETSPEEREKAFDEWKSEIDKMLTVLISVFSQELRDTYLTTVVEQEVHNTVFMSQELARRCIWINRVFTPSSKTPDNSSTGEVELTRRLQILQRDLKNQLSEKHIVRIFVKHAEGGLNLDIPEHKQYVNQVTDNLRKYLSAMINVIIDEHQEKVMLKPYFGIEATLLEELNQQSIFCQKAAQCTINREKTINEIKKYIYENNRAPFILYGSGGCGKTTLLARIAQCCHQWLPEALLVFRFVGITADSTTFEVLLNSIVNQLSLLAYGHKCYVSHNMEAYQQVLPNLLAASCLQRPVVIILDGIDQVRFYSSKSLDWIPTELPNNVKLIFSVSEDSDFYLDLSRKIDKENFLKMPLLDQAEAKGILISSVMQYNHSINSKIQDCVIGSVKECTIPLYSKVLAWQTSWWADKEHTIVPKEHLNDQLNLMLDELETILGDCKVQNALAIISSTKHGLAESEIIDLLSFDPNFHSNATYVIWALACITWSRLYKHLAPFLQWTLTGDTLGVQWRDNLLQQVVMKRYQDRAKWANQMVYDYYSGKWWRNKPENLKARIVNQDVVVNDCYNRRKLDELPFHYYQLHKEIENSEYITDLTWIYDKICGSNCYQILEDINMQSKVHKELTLLLRNFIETHATVLNYDGRQFYSHLRIYLHDKMKEEDKTSDFYASLLRMYNTTMNPPVFSLIPSISHEEEEEKEEDGKYGSKVFDLIVRLPETNQFFVSLSTINEEICVWDVKNCEKIRTLKGVPHPTDLVPIDQYKCIVLCRRELMVYDLNHGCFLTKLKGVMNQKMPFFGLHDQSHLVALSRNRMYVNLMNLDTGDCVTTFKAGEDRFLNSLLVSRDGRILVCGDETQKPFPLLVWNLQSKKLLYDLRIPHHDFITSLSAITSEGNYVCCVCHEIDEPNPNFIVVYDLQSGTLFKKWKPSCNTVSLEITSQGGCVISGLEDARIIVWDLITGNCRWTLIGHTAPVSSLKLDPTGSVFMSSDLECRDRSIRVWDINKGNLISVYTPNKNITACSLTSFGKHILLALEEEKSVLVLELKGPNVEESHLTEVYGEHENKGKIFNLKDAC